MHATIIAASPPSGADNNAQFDLTHLITEDDEPVDNFPSSKQQRLFVEPLYSSSKLQRPFLADSNVAIYASPKSNPIVPDMFLSMGVQVADDWWEKENRSYLMWEFHKPPEVVVEIVSNNKGKEDEGKLHDYAALGILYYVIYDPQKVLTNDIIRVYQLVAGEYLLRPDYRLAEVGLLLKVWYGSFEDKMGLWLRWGNSDGTIILTGAERAQQEQLRAERAQQRAEDAENLAKQERQRVEALLEQLRSLGVEPNLPPS